MIIVITNRVGSNTVTTLDQRIVVGVVRDVADMQDAQRPSGGLLKLFDECQIRGEIRVWIGGSLNNGFTDIPGRKLC